LSSLYRSQINDKLCDIFVYGSGHSAAVLHNVYVTTQIGYARVSKADGSQIHELQRDALVAAGVNPEHFYADAASGRRQATGAGRLPEVAAP
jgi:hypothetical protein